MMELFSISYVSKSVYKDLNVIVRFSLSFFYWKNKSYNFLYHFTLFSLRYLGALGIYTVYLMVELAKEPKTLSDYIMYGSFLIPCIFVLVMPKHFHMLIFYMFIGNVLKNPSIKFFDSHFEMIYHYGLVHKYAYSTLKKVVETEKIIKFFPGPYIMKKYLAKDSLDSMHDLLSSYLGDRYIYLAGKNK